MYSVRIYNKDFSAQKTTLAFGTGCYQLQYFDEIHKPGGASFMIKSADPRATADNLKMFNRIRIYKGTEIKWHGYIENLEVSLNEIQVQCVGLLGFYKHRIYEGNFVASDVETALTSILNSVNATDDTGVNLGSFGVYKTINDLSFSRSEVFGAFVTLAEFAGGEVEIDFDLNFNLKERLGTDKSATNILRYEVTKINMANIESLDVTVEGKDMANRVTGVASDGTTSTDSDTTSETNFGVLQKALNFGDSGSTDLATQTTEYMEGHKEEFYNPNIKINNQKVDIDSYELGDTVKLIISSGFLNLNRNDRIIKRSINLTENGIEELEVSLLPEGLNLLPSNFIQDILNVERRVRLLESGL